jgi:head-tail adaptor
MSFGKMNEPIEIVSSSPLKDAEGFAVMGDTVIANIRAYFEPRNSTEKWRNNAVFAEASALFRFRKIPGIKVDNSMAIICCGERYGIISAEDVRNRGMYVEVMAKAVGGSG